MLESNSIHRLQVKVHIPNLGWICIIAAEKQYTHGPHIDTFVITAQQSDAY